jgi:uncharacterized YigZ family protein
MPYSLAEPVASELVIKKSRFIARIESVPDRTAALAIVSSLRQTHPGAAHVCWALMAGGQSAANDDGEPSGTAGRPILEVLRHQDFDGVLATVVRYFGGVKLGAGGLVRAYTDAVATACSQATKIPHIARITQTWLVPYAYEGAIRRLAEGLGATLLVEHETQAVRMIFSLATEHAQSLTAAVANLTGGQALPVSTADKRAP